MPRMATKYDYYSRKIRSNDSIQLVMIISQIAIGVSQRRNASQRKAAACHQERPDQRSTRTGDGRTDGTGRTDRLSAAHSTFMTVKYQSLLPPSTFFCLFVHQREQTASRLRVMGVFSTRYICYKTCVRFAQSHAPSLRLSARDATSAHTVGNRCVYVRASACGHAFKDFYPMCRPVRHAHLAHCTTRHTLYVRAPLVVAMHSTRYCRINDCKRVGGSAPRSRSAAPSLKNWHLATLMTITATTWRIRSRIATRHVVVDVVVVV